MELIEIKAYFYGEYSEAEAEEVLYLTKELCDKFPELAKYIKEEMSVYMWGLDGKHSEVEGEIMVSEKHLDEIVDPKSYCDSDKILETICEHFDENIARAIEKDATYVYRKLNKVENPLVTLHMVIRANIAEEIKEKYGKLT